MSTASTECLDGSSHAQSLNTVISAASHEAAVLPLAGEEILAALFLKYQERLERMVDFRLDPRLLGRVDPADVVQEAYIHVIRRIDDFLTMSGVSPYVWLRQITWQTLLDIHRRHLGQKRNAGQEVAMHGPSHNPSTIHCLANQLAGSLTSPCQAAERNERIQLLHNAIAQLEDIDREILALRHFEQLTNGEVAEVLGISKTAASNRYIRALKRLREQLDTCTALGGE